MDACLVHLTQSTWRQPVNKHLKVPYSSNETAKSTVQSLLTLPFIPENDVEEVFNLILEIVFDTK